MSKFRWPNANPGDSSLFPTLNPYLRRRRGAPSRRLRWHTRSPIQRVARPTRWPRLGNAGLAPISPWYPRTLRTKEMLHPDGYGASNHRLWMWRAIRQRSRRLGREGCAKNQRRRCWTQTMTPKTLLVFPVQPVSSKPTKKQLKSSALERYAKARKNKSSPAPVPANAKDEDSDDLFREFTPIPEIEDSDEESDAEEMEAAENLEESFIVDEADGADPDATAALDRMRYSHRDLDEHFAVFIEYIIALDSDPEYLSTATEDEKEYFATAVTALRRQVDSLADSMTLSTWKAPFIATLNLRPLLADGVICPGNDNCHACWTRGMYACDVSASYSLSTQKGIYDPKTFQDIPEKKIKYGKATSFENNAEARNLPYPPRFGLVIGARCFKRALAYHEARHSLYNISVRVKEKIKALSDDNEELANDPNALLEAMKEEDFVDRMWGRFKADKKEWSRFANRQDRDALT
ncbi:hypothetical protein B0H15DRAFT_262013 [Mycena belliarum]|uniref:DUF4211 domain-containing protein n=1 Tax=Mycena belliarum TaxID=1033014 RepID=A0AAD6U4J3_9AGAR|nr:hypothetical protein B0H15DRAFT_262013 [Mycena belliae]